MKVLKALLETIGKRLLDETSVQNVRLYNDEGEDAKASPSVDIEFTPFEWADDGRKARSATITMILHCRSASYARAAMNAAGLETDVPELLLVDEVDRALHNFKPIPHATPIRIAGVAPDAGFGLGREWRLTATLTVINC